MGKKGSEWIDEEVKILEECYSQYMPLLEIQSRLPNRSYASISAKASKLGFNNKYIKPNNAKFKAEYNDYNWCYERLVNRSMSIADIALESGYSERVLQKWIYEKHHLDYKRDFKLNDIQKMLVTSGCLGDGHISKDLTYIESHAENQKDYIYWKYNILKNMCNIPEPTYYPATIKYFGDMQYNCQPSYRITTREIVDLENIRNMPRYDKIDCLDALGYSTHFLDDGSYNGYNWNVCLAEWTLEEEKLYIEKLKKLFGVKSWLKKDTRYITVDKESSDIMNSIILNNIPKELDIIKYKILKVA